MQAFFQFKSLGAKARYDIGFAIWTCENSPYPAYLNGEKKNGNICRGGISFFLARLRPCGNKSSRLYYILYKKSDRISNVVALITTWLRYFRKIFAKRSYVWKSYNWACELVIKYCLCHSHFERPASTFELWRQNLLGKQKGLSRIAETKYCRRWHFQKRVRNLGKYFKRLIPRRGGKGSASLSRTPHPIARLWHRTHFPSARYHQANPLPWFLHCQTCVLPV